MPEIEPSGDESHEPTLAGDRRPPVPVAADDAELTRPGSRPVSTGASGTSPSASSRATTPPTPSPASLDVPALQASGFARYDLRDEIGRGGLGVVRIARDTSLQRDVAVKSILRADSRRAVLSFVEEAQITGQLEHPNIVPVHEIGLDTAGHPYLAMKRVQGRTLREEIREAHQNADAHPDQWPATLQRLVDSFLKVCDAIAYAHSRGVIHRDLKPDNVMVGAFGEVLVMDWGLARPLGATAATASLAPPAADDPLAEPVHSDRRVDSPHVTSDGAVIGTPTHMPPEQAAGEVRELDERADVYALGTILYTLATGRPPFTTMDRQHVAQVLADVREGRFTPPRIVARARVSRELDAIVRKAMALDRDHRYATVQQLQADINAWRAHLATSARRAGVIERAVRWTRRHPTMTLSAALLLVAGLVVAVLVGQLQIRAEQQKAAEDMRKAAESTRDYLKDQVFALLGKQTRDSIAEFARRTNAARDKGMTTRAFGETLTKDEVDRFVDAFEQLFRIYEVLGTEPTAAQLFNRATILQTVGDHTGAIKDYDRALQLAPQEPSLLRDRACAYAAMGDIPAAMADFRAALRLPCTGLQRASILLNRADILHKEGEYQQAVDELTRVLEFDDSAFAYQNRGLSLLELKRYDEALADLDAALERMPENGAMRFGRGNVYLAMGRLDDAIADFREARKVGVQTDGIVNNLAIALTRNGEFSAVIDLVNEALERQPDTASWHNLRGVARLEIGEERAALADFTRSLELAPDHPRVAYNRGRALAALGDHTAAIAELDRAEALVREQGEEDSVLASILLHRARSKAALGDPAAAIVDFDQSLALTPGSGSSTARLDLARARVDRAAARLAVGDADGAIADCTAALEIDPDIPTAYYNRANAHLALRHAQQAFDDYTAAIQKKPDYVEAWTNRGLLRLEAANDIAGALDDHNEAIRIRADYAVAWNNRGIAHQASGDRPRALADYSKALELDPALVDAWINRGSVQHADGKLDDAIADYDKGLALDPRNTRALFNRATARQAKWDQAGAIADYTAVLEIDPTHWQAGATLGRLLVLSDRERARTVLQQAFRHCPDAAHRQQLAGFIRMVGGTVPAEDE